MYNGRIIHLSSGNTLTWHHASGVAHLLGFRVEATVEHEGCEHLPLKVEKKEKKRR
jgi:hypothetical protein